MESCVSEGVVPKDRPVATAEMRNRGSRPSARKVTRVERERATMSTSRQQTMPSKQPATANITESMTPSPTAAPTMALSPPSENAGVLDEGIDFVAEAAEGIEDDTSWWPPKDAPSIRSRANPIPVMIFVIRSLSDNNVAARLLSDGVISPL